MERSPHLPADRGRAAHAHHARRTGPRTKLPSERELSERYSTSRLTARRALQVLIAEGLLEPQRGVGVFVRRAGHVHRVASQPMLRRYREAGIAALAMETEQQGNAWRRELVHLGQVPAPALVAARLGVDQGAPVLCADAAYGLARPQCSTPTATSTPKPSPAHPSPNKTADLAVSTRRSKTTASN
ncbi:MAG: GntR family transcriptional regulator [Egibacteraceae bacterium]